MALRVLNIGASAGDNTGDKLRAAMDKIKNNFSELFSIVASTTLANKIFASPVGSSGLPSFRSLDLTDIPTAGASTDHVLKYNGSAVVWGDITASVTQAVLQSVYPVGSFYTSATTTANPNTILGFGTWVAVEGRVLVGVDSAQVEFDSLLETGGSKTHTLTINEIPAHTHGYTSDTNPGSGLAYGNNYSPMSITRTSGSAGGGQSHNNLQPYLVVAMWRRTV